MVTTCRCRELQEKLDAQRRELSAIGEQLMTAVQQKFELQEQLEAWQVTNDKLYINNLYA